MIITELKGPESSRYRQWKSDEFLEFLTRLETIRGSWSETERKFRERLGSLRRRKLIGLIGSTAKPGTN